QHILQRQLPDGGWNIYFGGPSEINASVKAYFALKLAGYSADLPFMREARANILRLGGVPRVNTFSKLYLALLGQFPWKYLPTIPVEMILLPTWAPFHIYKMSSWSRAMLVLLAIINHFKPTRELPGEKQLHELYPLGTEHKDFRLPRDERTFTWRNLFLRGDDALKMLHRIPWKPFRRLALEEAERWMMERIGDGSDGLATVYPAMLNALIALHALRYPNSHPALAKAQKDYEDLFQRALAWQLSFQCRDGGWAAFDKDVIDGWLENMPFADHNAILDPTCSDLTARTLELFGYINFNQHDASVESAIRYLIATQEDDGSWYGRWGVNYIYGTWQVLRGLRAIGQDMTQDWILRGRD